MDYQNPTRPDHRAALLLAHRQLQFQKKETPQVIGLGLCLRRAKLAELWLV